MQKSNQLLEAATPPTQNNFGPGNDKNLQLAATQGPHDRTWNWVCFIKVAAGKTIQYAFSFSAENENEMILYDYPSWGRIGLARINNYDFQLPGHAWSFTNGTDSDVYHALTGWHKNSPPDGQEHWWQSPMYFEQPSDSEVVVGFADGWYDVPFGNGKITILRDAVGDCTPMYQHEIG